MSFPMCQLPCAPSGRGAGVLPSRRQSKVALIALVAGGVSPAWATASYVPNPIDFATQVISSNITGSAPYNNPQALLGPPTVTFDDPYDPQSDPKGYDNSKIIEPPYYTDRSGNDVITKIPQSTNSTKYSVTLELGRPVSHDPGNPYGVDLIVYGNSFFTGSGAGGSGTSDTTNLNNYHIGGLYGHPLIVSVSPDNVHWYTFPTTPTILPFQAYQWNDATQMSTNNLLNFNQPVDPAIASSILAGGLNGQSASSVLDAYQGASGGTGFDISGSGFSSIEYVNLQSTTTDYAVVDAVAAVDAVPEPATLSVLATSSAMLLVCRRRRHKKL